MGCRRANEVAESADVFLQKGKHPDSEYNPNYLSRSEVYLKASWRSWQSSVFSVIPLMETNMAGVFLDRSFVTVCKHSSRLTQMESTFSWEMAG